VAFFSASLVGANAAPAQHTNCPLDNICVYENINHDHGNAGRMVAYHVSRLYDCKWVYTPEWVSSVVNNTRFHFELNHPLFRIGVAAPYKSYGYVGLKGDNMLRNIISPGCWGSP
jgi:hypothetical protein